MTTIYIARHGETEWNVQGLMQGHMDSPLTENGRNQARELAEALRHIHFDAIFSSDLLRAKRTAEIIALEKELAIQTTKALRERNFGTFEGHSLAEYGKLFESVQKLSWKERINHKPSEDAESIEELLMRYITFLREIAVAYSGKTVLMVSHGGVMRNLLISLGYWESNHKEKFGNAGYMILESEGVDFFVKEVKGVVARI